MNANVPPGFSQRRTRRQELRGPLPLDVAQPEPAEHAVDLPIRLRPGVADVDVGPQAMGDQPIAGAIERRLGGVVEPELALGGEERRPPAGAGGELDDLALERERVEPRAGAVELRVPGRVVDRAVRVAAAAQVPVVVLAGAGLVVGDHRIAVGSGGRGRGIRGGRRSPPARVASPRSPRPGAVIASRSRNFRNGLSPALPRQSGQSWAQPSRSSGRARRPRPAAPQAVERRARQRRLRWHRPAQLERRPAADRRRLDERRRGRRSRPASRCRR